jgi:hypothetical protein
MAQAAEVDLDLRIMIGLDVFIIICVGLDSFWHRRLHPAFAWGRGRQNGCTLEQMPETLAGFLAYGYVSPQTDQSSTRSLPLPPPPQN